MFVLLQEPCSHSNHSRVKLTCPYLYILETRPNMSPDRICMTRVDRLRVSWSSRPSTVPWALKSCPLPWECFHTSDKGSGLGGVLPGVRPGSPGQNVALRTTVPRYSASHPRRKTLFMHLRRSLCIPVHGAFRWMWLHRKHVGTKCA